MTENGTSDDRLYDCMRECYLNSRPSVDLATVDHTIKPNEHIIKLSTFDAILKKHECLTSDYLMVFLNKGPKLVQG